VRERLGESGREREPERERERQRQRGRETEEGDTDRNSWHRLKINSSIKKSNRTRRDARGFRAPLLAPGSQSNAGTGFCKEETGNIELPAVFCD
jgi:hypothetical protein